MSEATDREFDSLNGNSPNSEKEMVFCENRGSRNKTRTNRIVLVVGVLIGVCGLICVVTGVVFLERAKQIYPIVDHKYNDCSAPETKETTKQQQTNPCSYSDELSKSGLLDFFDKVSDAYYTHHPYEIPYKYGVSREEVMQEFKPFNPSPENLKAIVDKSRSLLAELNSIKINKLLLKPREAKTLAKTRHFLEQNFGSAYDNGYYTGEWMLGPSRFCYMQKFAQLPWNIRAFLARVKPRTVGDMEYVISVLKHYGQGIRQYQNNMEMGVKVGMVNAIEECAVGYDCLAAYFPAISLTLSAQDILKERLVGALLGESVISESKNASVHWFSKYQKSLARSLRDAAIDYLGAPLAELFRYLSGEYRLHCVPSDVSSGLASRPVQFVYYNGRPNLSEPTTMVLPSGQRVSGKKAYERILKFFTTTKLTPDAVHAIGWAALRTFYPQVVDIAKRMMGTQNETEAISEFRVFINSSEMYFNDKPFPANESDERAFRLCTNSIAAQFYCPVRFATLQKWFRSSMSTLSMMEPKLLRMFHWMVGPRKTTPICPVSMATNFVARNGAQSYQATGPSCRSPARYFVPFFLDRMGPKYSEWTVNAHEAMPGHHMQSQGFHENFRDLCNPLLSAVERERYSYTAYSEGWGLYAENPLIANDTSTYERNPLQRFGMLKWQIWRALRLIVDTGIHYKGMTRQRALQLFSQYAWDDSDVAKKEVTRYQSGPGQATAYMIGQRAIINMRRKAAAKLGRNFDLEDFHYYFLSIGSAPLSFIDEQIDKFTDCESDSKGPGCHLILEDRRPQPVRTVAQSVEEIFEEDMTAPHIHEM